MTTQEHIESMIPTPRAVVESINQQVKQLEKRMKTTSTTQTPTGEITTISIDGEAVARFFGSGSAEAAKRFVKADEICDAFANSANLADENNRLRNALDSIVTIASCAPHDDEEKANQEFTRIMNEARAALKGINQ